MRAREAGTLTNWPTGIARENTKKRGETHIYFLKLPPHPQPPFPIHPAPLNNSQEKKALTLASSSHIPFYGLSYVVSERQPSLAPPRELQASVTLSYMRHVKSRSRANSNRSVQNQVKCRRLCSSLLVIVTFGAQKLVIWEEEREGIIRGIICTPPPAHLSENCQRPNETYIRWDGEEVTWREGESRC